MAGQDHSAAASRDYEKERLLIEAAQQDPANFVELYDNYFHLVYSYVARRVSDRQAAEDLTSTVFQKALEHLPRFTWRGVPFGVWLLKVASNVVADQRKRTHRENLVGTVEELKDSDIADPAEMTQYSLEELEESATLFRMVNQLPRDQCRVIICRFGDEKSIAEIAKELGRSEGAVKQLQFRALENLRARLNKQRGEEDV